MKRQVRTPLPRGRWRRRIRTTSTRVVAVTAVLALAGCFPIDRTTVKIVPVSHGTFSHEGSSYDWDFYRNDAYDCGRTGKFTFLIVEPSGLDENTRAPLWILLHGGGVGYYDQNTKYHGSEKYNDSESASDLGGQVDKRLSFGNGSPKTTTVSWALSEGYRVLVPSMCDHDLHAGMGTDYPNNPNGLGPDGGQVNGLQANLAALDYTVANRASGKVFVQGTSAGSVGAWALTYALAKEGVYLNGAILDSYFIGPRTQALFDADVAAQQKKDPDFDPAAVVAKIGYFMDNAYLEDEISGGFRAVPLLTITGGSDDVCGGNEAPIPAATALGFDNNCEYWQGGIADAIAGQGNQGDQGEGTPHRALFFPGLGHTPSNNGIGPVNQAIWNWLRPLTEGGAPIPFP